MAIYEQVTKGTASSIFINLKFGRIKTTTVPTVDSVLMGCRHDCVLLTAMQFSKLECLESYRILQMNDSVCDFIGRQTHH